MYTLVFKLPSSLMVTRASKKGMEPSLLLASFVNWILSSMVFKWLKKLSSCIFWMITNVSSTNLLQKVGGVVLCLWFVSQRPPYVNWLLWGSVVNPWMPPLFMEPALEDEACVVETELQQTDDVLYCHECFMLKFLVIF